MGKRVLVIYHFFYPDDVVSARHLSDLAAGLVQRGWEVTALTSNRFCREPKRRIKQADKIWRGVRIHRSYRPAFRQSSNLGRLLNGFWLMMAWLVFIARQPAHDVIILGTDPQFGYLMLPFIRLLKRCTKLVSWGFDIYPEAIKAHERGLAAKLALMLRPLTGFCYRRLDGMADIGPCMRRLLDRYTHGAKRATLVPWALLEPEAPLEPVPEIRRQLFGEARLALLYSGTIGRAHCFEGFIALARELRRRNAGVAFCFAGRGNRYDELRQMVTEEDSNISFAGFANEAELAERLGAGDIHMLSLREGWEGIVVPSKFFGSLAAGKAILYEGSRASSIKTWIEEYDLGFVLTADNLVEVADELCRFADNPELLRRKQENTFNCYHEHFSARAVIDNWDSFMRDLLHA